MGCSGRLTCRKVEIGRRTEIGELLEKGEPCVKGITKYTYYQIYRDGKLIDCLRTPAIARRMYGKKITVQPGM